MQTSSNLNIFHLADILPEKDLNKLQYSTHMF